MIRALLSLLAVLILLLGRSESNSRYDVPDFPAIFHSDTIPPPLKDREGNFTQETKRNPFDLKDPPIIEQSIEYDPETGLYIVRERIGDGYYRAPTYMTFQEYSEYKQQQAEDTYFRKLSGVGDPIFGAEADPVNKIDIASNLIDRLFGGSEVDIQPQGGIDLTFGVDYQKVSNPVLTIRQQRNGGFDFDMDINVSVNGKIGEKLNLNFSHNTQATFDFDNQVKLQFDSDQFSEDDIVKKIEAGNVSMPLQSELIQGSQSLFGVKTELQFGRLGLTLLASQQKSKQENLQLQGGSLLQEFRVNADEYDENRHFLLGHFFRDQFEPALANLPQIRSLATITKVEIWVTNDRFETQNVRDVVALADLGEYDVITADDPDQWRSGAMPPRDLTGAKVIPDNSSNTIYQEIINSPGARSLDEAVRTLQMPPFQFIQGRDFEKVRARMLRPSEYTLHPELGFISLNINLRQDQVLAISYEYTYNGRPYQVGEFTNDSPIGTDTLQVLYTKLLKATSQRIDVPLWDLMMKNFYSIGAFQVSQEDFKLDVFYEDPGAGFKRFLPESNLGSQPLIQVFNLDNLNSFNDPQPDGIFDFVPGLTIDTRSGRVMFPVLEPFGSSLSVKLDPQFRDQYVFQQLYDSTLVLAQEYAELNRFVIRGEYKSSVSREISLNAFNIPRGSVVVRAGAQILQEGVHYEVDYNIGRIRILDDGILNSGVPVNVSFEDKSLFSFQTKTMLGLRADYQVSKNLNIGSTILKLFERPFTQKVNFGEDPISNTIFGLDVNYSDEAPWLTRLVDALPGIQTRAPSSITLQAEGALLRPGHPRVIDQGDDKGGVVYLDDFEGSSSNIDLKTPHNKWVIASVPQNDDSNSNPKFPESQLINDRRSGVNRALLNWYRIDRSIPGSGGNPYTRQVSQTEIFPNRDVNPGFNDLFTFDLTYYPHLRGPYNFDYPEGTEYSEGLDYEGQLRRPETRWAGIMRELTTTNFEASNIEYIEFWLLNPFMEKDDGSPVSDDGTLYINLGNISEDILRDSRKFFENGLPRPDATAKTDTTNWGRIPRTLQVINSFDNDPAARLAQDVGLDGLDDSGERMVFGSYLESLANAISPIEVDRINTDPSNDNFIYFSSDNLLEEFQVSNINELSIFQRYQNFNNQEGNSQVPEAGANRVTSSTNIPDGEDLNKDNTLNEAEAYYEYAIPMLNVGGELGSNPFITDVMESQTGKWYRFKIPVDQFSSRVGGIRDFRSIRFVRMYLQGFDERITFRLARLDLVRNQWRRYKQELCGGDDIDQGAFDVSPVSIEENSERLPFNYVVPPGIQRENALGPYPNLRQNEQSLALDVCGLTDGCARAIYKTLNMDLRTFKRLKMFVHADSDFDYEDGDLSIFVRLGSDFNSNYYEYEIPLVFSDPAVDPPNDAEAIWKEENEFDLPLDLFKDTKILRNRDGVSVSERYSQPDPEKPDNFVHVAGNPNLGYVRTVMIGIRNPADDRETKCAEIWINELRLTGLNERSGVAGIARADFQLADFGSLSLAGNYSGLGWGAIDQNVNLRQKETIKEFDVTTSLQLGKFFGENSGIRIPFFAQVSTSTATPEFDPYDLDLTLDEKMDEAETSAARDSIRDQAIDYSSVKSINFTRVRKDRTNNSRPPLPWDISNFSVSYSYTQFENRDPIIEQDLINNHKGGLEYRYTTRPLYLEPFKNIQNDKFFRFLKELNFNPLPNSFTFNTELDRFFGEKVYRFSSPQFSTWFTKRFTWDRAYSLQWDLTRSLKLSFNSNSSSVIDEPDEYVNRQELERIDPKVRNDSIWTNLKNFGRPKEYQHSVNVSYNLPLRYLPFMDWVQVRAQASANFGWSAAPLNLDSLGNVIQNSQDRQVTADLNFEALYNKSEYLRKISGGSSSGRVLRPTGRPQGGTSQDASGDVSLLEKILIRPLLAIRKLRFNYRENYSSVVPGFTPDPKFLGLSEGLTAPGWGYALGWHPSRDWLFDAADDGWITRSLFLNQEVIKNYSQTYDGRLTLEPFRNFRIEVSMTRNFTQNHSEFFKNLNLDPNLPTDFQVLTPRDVGSFTVSYMALNTLFNDDLVGLFNEFEDSRQQISGRLGTGTHDKDGASFTQGYGRFQQDVVIPSFISAYTGIDVNDVKLNLFKEKDGDLRPNITPRPNWTLTYSGLNQLPWFRDILSGFTLTHGYRSTLSVNTYNTDLNYDHLTPNQFNPATLNFYSQFEIPAVVINESFSPLIGVDLKTVNDINFRLNIARNRNLALNLTDYQLVETKTKEFVIGFGYTLKNVILFQGTPARRRTTRTRQDPNLPADPQGTAQSNDLSIAFDLSFRDDKTINHILDQDQSEPTRGLKSLRISPSVDYQLNRNLTLRLFFDYNKTEPFTSASFPITSSQGGVTVSFTLN